MTAIKPSTSPRTGPPPPQQAEVIEDPLATTFELGSQQDDGVVWRILVGLPNVPAPVEGYSAFISTDGNATFPVLWHQREQLAPEAPVALIGIGYPCSTRFDQARRWYDLTSPHMVQPAAEPSRGPGDHRTGGREALLDMVQTLLLPALKQRIPLNMSNLTLYGHSLGGLFTVHAMLTRPRLFTRYVAADPSTWWNSGEIVREARVFLGGVAAAGGRVTPRTSLWICQSGAWNGAKANRPAPHDLVSSLGGVEGLHVTLTEYPDETHGSLIEPSLAQTLLLHVT
ncbi:uncharacterized protein EHS24_005300 [Apiotrichum porosum]|uniref:Alpha/beta hydrolase n=1 Tax=Apiotrichum porosum TaxID=105984 RepID=A0A427XDD1_9TREE|nr:uncharacterized protein EHS24_005300 [Apiotrichum porosum]RSH76724.1 hypothetical protein EHS24_005300 [Apiotrichum porosum]